jgi:hypothetical protein
MSDEREIQEVLARYVRAADQRDGAAMSNIFLPEGRVEIFYNNAGQPELIGELVGSEAINVKGDTGTLDAQFVVFNVLGEEKPEAGWPKGAFGAQGTITPIETGYYRPILKKVDGRWMMAHHRIYLDLPMAF